jgi:uncharacterized protein (TIGR03083 family)
MSNDAPALSLGSPEISLAHVERETRRFVEVGARSPLAAHVPTYPAFTVETLAAHIGRGLRIFHTIASGGTHEPSEVIPAPEGPAAIEWVEAGLEDLLTVLGQVSPDKLVTFPHGVGDLPVRAVAPTLAVEVGVHRWDLESVLGDHAPIPADLAVAEIDKVFESYAPRLAGARVAPIGGTVQLRATDTDVAWQASVDDGRLHTVRSNSDEADVVVSAPIEDLALIVWKRWPPPRPGVEIIGPTEALKRLLSIDYIPDPRTTPAH